MEYCVLRIQEPQSLYRADLRAAWDAGPCSCNAVAPLHELANGGTHM